VKKSAGQLLSEDLAQTAEKYYYPNELARLVIPDPRYKKYAEELIHGFHKEMPDICLTDPIGGMTTLEDNKIILMAPWPIMNLRSLAILAHERKHRHQYENLPLMVSKPDWLIELEAECFMIKYLKINGFQIPNAFIKEAKSYVGEYIHSDVTKRDIARSFGNTSFDGFPLVKFPLPDKNIVMEWIRNPYFTDEIINLVPGVSIC